RPPPPVPAAPGRADPARLRARARGDHRVLRRAGVVPRHQLLEPRVGRGHGTLPGHVFEQPVPRPRAPPPGPAGGGVAGPPAAPAEPRSADPRADGGRGGRGGAGPGGAPHWTRPASPPPRACPD